MSAEIAASASVVALFGRTGASTASATFPRVVGKKGELEEKETKRGGKHVPRCCSTEKEISASVNRKTISLVLYFFSLISMFRLVLLGYVFN